MTRALSCGEQANAGILPKLVSGNRFGCELFFRYENFRTSVVSIYEENGELAAFTQIREHLNSYPDEKPRAELKDISGIWVGKKRSITPDLQISQELEKIDLELDPTAGKNKTFFLPDGIVINVPEKLKIGEKFEMVVGKMMIENKYKRMTVKYNQNGEFIQLISEVFDQKN
ncbi:DUF3598 family protein [Okeania sp.]|uniref:DUF3598 family protein n=1 Tax=Okeania sp. TaxID=3100323 RepID=UPI002B4AD455|nr:DUF3598 family protein [Okeania sp.]MEB3342744.1 DUF3598 family protein [Okeania sp.]